MSRTDLPVWRDRIERMSSATSPCPGLHGESWQRVHAGMLEFIDRLGAEAVDLGWTAPDLFGVHPTAGVYRVDHCGALVLDCAKAQWIDATRIGFGNLTYYRDKPGRPEGVPIWTVRP
ncbi:MAG: hypothetical protein DI590_26195 [Methylorubrum populi]|nr:MAG: hypothetical protein DI590_26195 [Methylorubrum populi]